MSPKVRELLFLVIGILGCLIAAADLVFVIVGRADFWTYVNLFTGLCLIFAGFGNVRVLRAQQRKRDSDEARTNDGDTSM